MRLLKLEIVNYTEIKTTPIKGTNKVRLIDSVYYTTKIHDYLIRHKVNSGFKFDGASIPQAFWSAVGHPFQNEYLAAACLHDWHYGGNEKHVSRKYADDLFYFILRHDGVNIFRARKMWLSVRLFGGKYWKGKS